MKARFRMRFFAGGAFTEDRVKSQLIRFAMVALIGFGVSPVSWAQSMSAASPSGSALGFKAGTGWLAVYIHGMPATAIPQITLTTTFDNAIVPSFPRVEETAWVFSGLQTGVTYGVEVQVHGYQPAYATAEIPDMPGGNANVVIDLKPIDEALTFHAPKGQFVLAPHAQKEVQQGLRDLRSDKIPSAQKHFQKAIQMAPGNPYVNYVMGMSYLLDKEEPQAQPYLEESVSLDPNQAASLLALGTLRFHQANYPGAIDLLSKAVKLEPSSWKSEWLLASSYLSHGDYAQARDHAEKALVAGKQQADSVRLVLVEAAADMGDCDGAQKTLASFLSEYPKDADALKLRAWLMNRRTSLSTTKP